MSWLLRWSLVGLAIAMLGLGRAHADVITSPEGTCIENHCYCDGIGRPYTVGPCSSTCEEICGTSSSSTSSSSGGKGGGLLLIGLLIAVAAFPPMFAVAPAATLELWFDRKGKNIFGSKAAARERWRRFVDDRKSTENLGKRVEEANTFFEKDPDMRDAMSSNIPTKRALPAVTGRFWWTNTPRLVPSRDFSCKQAGLLYPFHMTASDPIAGFPNSEAMLIACSGTFQPGVDSLPADAAGQCSANTNRCMHVRPDGRQACCPRGNSVYNAEDLKCYRDSDFRAAGNESARRFLGGEYCPASSP